MTLEDKVDILVKEYGLDLVLEQNDLTEEKVVTELIGWGLIDLEMYFYEDITIIGEE